MLFALAPTFGPQVPDLDFVGWGYSPTDFDLTANDEVGEYPHPTNRPYHSPKSRAGHCTGRSGAMNAFPARAGNLDGIASAIPVAAR